MQIYSVHLCSITCSYEEKTSAQVENLTCKIWFLGSHPKHSLQVECLIKKLEVDFEETFKLFSVLIASKTNYQTIILHQITKVNQTFR
jgi:hypothetical protein